MHTIMSVIFSPACLQSIPIPVGAHYIAIIRHLKSLTLCVNIEFPADIIDKVPLLCNATLPLTSYL